MGKATLPKRSKKYGVGKDIGGCVYVHRTYESELGDNVDEAKKHLPDGFAYTVVKLNSKDGTVSFIRCSGFDEQDEPEIEDVVTVRSDGEVLQRKQPSDRYIYHHKWLFVRDDYEGFNVEASKERSRRILDLADVNHRRIGKKSYWEENVIPLLDV